MQDQKIKPAKITKPIQLLAAWLTGLIILVSALLTATAVIDNPLWLRVLFGVTAVIIIPLFLRLIFLLQTKFRPEMQEDIYYSKYLSDKPSRKSLEQENKTKLIRSSRRKMIQKGTIF